MKRCRSPDPALEMRSPLQEPQMGGSFFWRVPFFRGLYSGNQEDSPAFWGQPKRHTMSKRFSTLPKKLATLGLETRRAFGEHLARRRAACCPWRPQSRREERGAKCGPFSKSHLVAGFPLKAFSKTLFLGGSHKKTDFLPNLS